MDRPLNAAELEYIFGRLDMEHARVCARQAWLAWEKGERAFEVCFQPGDGTHYALLFVALGPRIPLYGGPGGGTGGHAPSRVWGIEEEGTRLLVYWVQRSSGMGIDRGEYVSPDYVLSNFDTAPASALALAVLFNLITREDEEWIGRLLSNVREIEAAEAAAGL